jgi:GPH family glycoside/pentoside/hexuronide:cation symporter
MDVTKEKEQKLKFGKKLSWATGGMADCLMSSAIFPLAMPIYNIALGVSPVLIGYAMAIPRIWDAFADPLVGNISDNTNTRLGRRRPYIFMGAILAGILFALIWTPPTGLSEFSLFLYFLILSTLFFTAYSVFTIPWNALGYELSKDYNERTNVMAYRGFLASLASALLMPWPYKLCFMKLFGTVNEIQGVRVVGIIYGSMMILLGIIPAIFCKEQISFNYQKKLPLFKSLKETFKNKAFVILSCIMACVIIGVFLVSPLQTYIFIYHVFQGNKVQGANLSAAFQITYNILGMAIMPLIVNYAAKWGKKRVLQIGLLMIMCGYISTSWAFNSRYPYLALVICIFNSPGLACVSVLSSSMLADICDVDELNTGLRREGMYGGIFSWIFKVGMGAVIAISGIAVSLSGFDAALGANQKPQAIFNLRCYYAIAPVLILLIAFLLTFLFPITEKQMRQIRNVLNKGSLSNTINNR